MNAVIQCLAHTPPLADYFLSNDFKAHLSENEKIASCFAEVLEHIYPDKNGLDANYPYRPVNFLRAFTVEDVAPVFGDRKQRM